MRILVVSPTPTHPQDAGNRARIHAMLAALKAGGHSIHLCLLDRERVAPEHLRAMEAAWDELVLVPHDRTLERPTLGDDFALDDWVQPAAEAAWRDLAARRPGFGMVIAEYVFLSKALTFFGAPTLRLLDTHDVLGGRAERLRAAGLPPAFFHTTEAEEARGLARADAVIAIQAEEREALEARSPVPVVTLGHLPFPGCPPLPPRPAGTPFALGYLGSVNPINARALSRFVDALDPATLGAELVVAGGAARALQPGPGLRLMGPVAGADELYAQADLVVNPHEGGTGLKIKTVEALSRGRPVIGTLDAFAGLSPEAPFHAAPDAAALAAIARRAVGDPAFRAEIAEASAALWRRYAAGVAAERARLSAPALRRALEGRPRLLMVTDLPFWEEALGNHARIAALCRALRAEMDLDLYAIGEEVDAARAQALLGARGRIFQAPPPAPLPATPLPRALTPFERRNLPHEGIAQLAQHLKAHPVQAVMVQYVRLSWARHAVPPGVLRVLDTHDVMSLRAQNFARFGKRHHIRIGVQEELEILDGFDLVLAIQAAEHRWLDRLLPGRVLLAPHALPPVAPARGCGAPVKLGFLGGDSPMNTDAMLWLLDQAWPALAPLGAELHVAGAVCDALPPGRAGVVLHGAVADPHAFLDGLDIAVNPVFYGGGLKIKTVEYLNHGLPCVLSAEALTGLSGDAWLLARDRAEFIAHLSALILDPGLRARLGAAAFAHARRHFGADALAPAMRAMAALAQAAPRA